MSAAFQLFQSRNKPRATAPAAPAPQYDRASWRVAGWTRRRIGNGTVTRKATLLVVDDEPDVRDVLSEYFAARGYAIVGAEDAPAAKAAAAAGPVDLALVDVAMPGEDGLSLAAHLRERHPAMGIIMLTAAGTPIDRAVGLEVGADDYVAKPFHPRELEARVKSVLRRTPIARPAARRDRPVRIGRCTLDPVARQLVDEDGRPVPVSALDLDLLQALVAAPHRPVSRERLLTMHRREWTPLDRSVDLRIMRLRRKIEPDPARPRFIRTLRNEGYLFVPEGSIQ
jgi:two-component system phosphate regulon response regulator OmpR